MLGYQYLRISFIVCFLFIQACATSSSVIPEALESRVDKQLSFSQIIQNPDNYNGEWVLLGGEVLHAQNAKDGTRLEILQLPLNEWEQPRQQRTLSGGRFFAFNETFLDPATFPPHTRVTIVGEMTGSQLDSLDETDYRYPMLKIHHIHVWENDSDRSFYQQQPRWSIFGGGGTGGRSGGGLSIGIGF
ncbi:Slp family lipoprotein [Candidatus Nitrospira salsa]